jgi:hypothetical protein
MWVNDAKNVLKLCDFGFIMFVGENKITPCLVSQFHNALEINKHLIEIPCAIFYEYLGHVELPPHGCGYFSLTFHHCFVLCVQGLCNV